jgi:predicted HTH domain antitoxin
MTTVTIEVPDEAFAALRRSPRELGKEMRLAEVMVWYAQGRVSHENAASFAGLSRIEFIDALAAAKLPAFHVDVDELMEDVEIAHQAHREHVAAGLSRQSRSPGDAPGGSQ